MRTLDLWGAPKKLNKSKYLQKHFGGKWTYDYICHWLCDDGKRWVARTASCMCDEPCWHPPRYFLYEDGKQSIEINWMDK